jgi:hypothetical protein
LFQENLRIIPAAFFHHGKRGEDEKAAVHVIRRRIQLAVLASENNGCGDLGDMNGNRVACNGHPSQHRAPLNTVYEGPKNDGPGIRLGFYGLNLFPFL